MAPQGVQGLDNPAGPGDKRTNNDVVVRDEATEVKQEGCCRKFTDKMNRGLENFFAKVGWTVGTHPWKTIFISLSIAFLCMAGILEYKVENRGEKNWVDQGSEAIKHKDWVEENFVVRYRTSNIMYEDASGNVLTSKGLLANLMGLTLHLWVDQSTDSIKHKDWVEDNFPVRYRTTNIMYEDASGNVLTSKGLLALLDLEERTRMVLKGTKDVQWEDICYRSANACIPQSVLELWHYNRTVIENLNETQILDAINTPNLFSPMTNKPFNAELFIGGPVVRKNGKIEKAAVAKMNFRITLNEEFDSGEGRPVDENGERWEEEFEKEMEKGASGGTVYYVSEWGREDASSNAANGDLQFFVIGYLLVIIYLSIMLGSFSRINHKIYLAAAGIFVIGVAVGVAYGLGSAFQMKKTAVHDVLAFLLLGIGVDDVFVIIQTWDNIGGPVQDGRSVAEKTSLTLKHAGVSILVTSVTDICAFLIGASTILPALQSFCIWCAIGILTVFLLTSTFFTACLAIDSKRQEKRRDACLCCITLSDSWEATECSQKSYLQLFLKNYYAPAILSKPGKVIGLVMVAGLLAGGAYGLSELEQNFDWDWFLPKSSSPRQYSDKLDIFFPSSGIVSNVYTGKMDYFDDYQTMDKIHKTLEGDQYVAEGSIDSWYTQYHSWLNTTYTNEIIVTNDCLKTVTACKPATNDRFMELLHIFLKSREGIFYGNNVMFSSDEKHVIAASIRFQHVILQGSSMEIDAMDAIKDEIKPSSTDSEPDDLLPFAYNFQYISWETNKIITTELFRNVLLATLCVFLVTLFLLSHLWTSLLVVACVVLALIDIAGFMNYWDLTIDTVTTIIMVLAIGLTVDYSAHIAHGFMVANKGSKNDRMAAALADIGPAVIHGGMSTFIAFVLLAASESYVFFTFFKVFFLVVCFGMFHGLVFLPIILSLVGPRPYNNNSSSTSEMNETTVEKPVQLQNMKNTNENFNVITEAPRVNSGYTIDS